MNDITFMQALKDKKYWRGKTIVIPIKALYNPEYYGIKNNKRKGK